MQKSEGGVEVGKIVGVTCWKASSELTVASVVDSEVLVLEMVGLVIGGLEAVGLMAFDSVGGRYT